jgi:phosphoribosylaminoimidazole (AIR) synthetase
VQFTGTIDAAIQLKNGTYLTLVTGDNLTEEFEKLKGKKLSIEIKQYREKRSLDANAYMWVLLQKMAELLKTSKDELYLEVLGRYGVFTHIIVKPNVVDRVKAEWRNVRDLGEVVVNGVTGIQLQCYFGSSTYNTKEMSVLIDGVVSECKELGIDTISDNELRIMKEKWGV